MASGTLYTYPDNFRAYKILIAAKYSGANLTVASSPPAFQFGETNKSNVFLEKFPLGKVPAFESSTGECYFESNAIAHLVGSAQLRGTSVEDATCILQWINFADNEILPASCTWVYPCLGIIQFNKQETEKAKEQIKKVLTVLNQHLQTRTFLVGEKISQADITVCCNMLQLYKLVLDPEFRKSYINVNRWFTTMINQPQVKSVIGTFSFCTKMAQFDAKKYAEIHGQGKKEKKEKQPKVEKAPPKPKEPKAGSGDELEAPPAPKREDPFAKLDKGTFNMDEFKRSYSNNDTKTVALPYFWEHFDKQHYSIWLSEYKYDSELTYVFMSANLIRGMFQRLEKLNKQCFASVLIFGEDTKNSISGIWIWLGHELVFNLSPDWEVDYDCYNWKKLDPDSPETKTLVDEYLSWEGNFGGKKVNQGKIFK
ncbi:elongation factor 1-gamma [Octopus bimaculoides]|uniref:Elongation factor 1-gamma n=1 Tax=Octopus bimaculoides TaxID=37653 RepID=A0A0L8I9X0_OCTBM|nr:elongation factor 1-gamma [Octopus bimaculoides]|eukprot:XP_014783693.1 PREDICTED: elongation factor 1-gamma-like [Octopus bimaculoides]